jgi:hypothetical protein
MVSILPCSDWPEMSTQPNLSLRERDFPSRPPSLSFKRASPTKQSTLFNLQNFFTIQFPCNYFRYPTSRVSIHCTISLVLVSEYANYVTVVLEARLEQADLLKKVSSISRYLLIALLNCTGRRCNQGSRSRLQL